MSAFFTTLNIFCRMPKPPVNHRRRTTGRNQGRILPPPATGFPVSRNSGQIRKTPFYGVSSNTCTAKHDNPESTSASRMLEAAQAAAREQGLENSHFCVIQLPMNMLEAGALLTSNTGPTHTQTIIEFAQANQLAVLVNRPLNAIPGKGEGIVRLADPQAETPNTNFETQLPKVSVLEQDYKRVLALLFPKPNKDDHHPIFQLGRRTSASARIHSQS